MPAPPTSSIARIYDIADQVVGAGFLVSNLHIFTCAHVIAQALQISEQTPETPDQTVTLDFPLVQGVKKLSARVVCWKPIKPRLDSESAAHDEDIAVLELQLQGVPELRSKPVRLTIAENVWNHPFGAFGFPTIYNQGTWAKGRMMAQQANGWIQIEAENQFGYFVQPGYSGTAIWDEQLDAVVGMVVVSDKRVDTKAAFFIPTRVLATVWPQLSHSLDDSPAETTREIPRIWDHPIEDFWTEFDQNSNFHHADPNNQKYRSDVLLIAVSLGEVNASWDELPAQALARANVDLDVLSIRYSPDKLTSTSVKRWATKLRQLLSSTFATYKHLLFITKDADSIVKQMLVDDAGDILGSTNIRLLNDFRLTSRTRCIVGISANGHVNNRLSKKIADEFKKELNEYEIAGLPTPDTLELSSTTFEEVAEDQSQQNNGRRVPRSRLPTPLVAQLAERLAPFYFLRSAAIARLTVFRSFAVDPQVRTFFGSQENTADEASSEVGASQAELLEILTELASNAGPETLRVLTGGAGTGKSVLLRRLARRLSVLWLRGTKHAALPVFIPLNQFTVGVADTSPARLWESLCREWIPWANDLLASNATEFERQKPELITIDDAWVHHHLRRLPTTLILDGVDEFMLNNPGLSITDFAALLRFLRSEFTGNAQFLIIAGIRSSPRDTSLIADSESDVLTLRGMTLAEASAIFPSAARLVDHASDLSVRRLLLTPLVLSALEKSNLMLKPEAYLNRAALIGAALTATIESLRRSWNGKPYTTDDWISALSLLMWLQFRELRGEISDEFVATEAAKVIDAWTKSSGNNPATPDIIKSFRLLLDSQARAALLRKSIFLSSRENFYRLRHKEWGDYLVAHYAVLCIRYGHFDDLAMRALNHDIYIVAGQQLEECDTDRHTVRALVQRASVPDGFLIVGNFSQMLGAAFAPVTGDVLEEELLANLSLFPVVVKFAMLSSLSSRVLARDPRDKWHDSISPVVVNTLRRLVLDEQENSLVRSLSWCFLKRMNHIDSEWLGLWANEKQILDTLSVISTKTATGFEVNARQRSIQAAFMRIQSYALEIPTRVISTIHYLYPLVVAYHNKVELDRTVAKELPLLLSDPALDATYRNHPVPEIAAIWNRCRELYAGTVANSPSRE